MLQNMKKLQLDNCTETYNAYNEPIKTYSRDRDILIAIFYVENQQGYQNSVLIDEYSHIGLTAETVSKGQRIDEKFIVKYVLGSRPYNRVFLQEVK